MSLATGTRLTGWADRLPDGKFLVRLDSVSRSDGSSFDIAGSAIVPAVAGERAPLRPGMAPPSFEFDLELVVAGAPAK